MPNPGRTCPRPRASLPAADPGCGRDRSSGRAGERYLRRRTEVGTMTEQVTYFKPSCGTKLVIKVVQREVNTCDQLADSLFQIASRECPQPGLEGQPFQPNYVYEFAN